MSITPEFALELDGYLEVDLREEGRLGKVKRYLEGDHDLPYMPKGHKGEFEHLAKRAVTNWLPLLSDTFAKALFVDGYRPAKSADNAAAWAYWQDNGLDARQQITHRGALEYGTSYVLVLRGKDPKRPVIKPLSPLRSLAWYAGEDDEFPEYALERLGTSVKGTRRFRVYDATNVYTVAVPSTGKARVESTEAHRMGVTPIVRFRDRVDGVARGVIAPAITMQDRINEVVFATLIALQYASFRQRWATGLAVPEEDILDAEGNPTGETVPVEPFEAAVNRLWVSDSSETKFGDFAQTDTTGHLALYMSTVKSLAAVSQINPNILTGDLINVSAEGLAQLQDTTQRKIGEYEILFGESWEAVFRLAALAAGDASNSEDAKAEVRWRDTEARSLVQTVEALGLMAEKLGVPVQALWARIPGVTDSEVTRWEALKASDPLAELTREIARQTADQTATNAVAEPGTTEPVAPTA